MGTPAAPEPAPAALAPDSDALRNERAIYAAEIMLGNGVFDLPRLLRILKGQPV